MRPGQPCGNQGPASKVTLRHFDDIAGNNEIGDLRVHLEPLQRDRPGHEKPSGAGAKRIAPGNGHRGGHRKAGPVGIFPRLLNGSGDILGTDFSDLNRHLGIAQIIAAQGLRDTVGQTVKCLSGGFDMPGERHRDISVWIDGIIAG